MIRSVHDSDESTIVSFNSNKYDLDSRITTYYSKYHKILTEAMWFLQPALVIGIHSHPPSFKDKTLKDILVYSPTKNSIAQELIAQILEQESFKEFKVGTAEA